MNAGCRALKKKALERYYAAPSICKQCGKVIAVKEGQQPGVVKKKKFCNHSCAATHNNKSKYDWSKVQEFFDAGNNQKQCAEHFGFSQGTLRLAVRRGDLQAQSRNHVPLDTVMIENSAYNRTCLKARLLNLGILKNECSICGLTEWRGKPLIMVLDHINGVRDDNRRENLRMICPNCGSQLPTFCRGPVLTKREKAVQ